jgi:hypothetical protein
MPQVRRILIDGLSCEQAKNGIQIDGAEGCPIRDVTLKHIACRAENNLILRHTEEFSMEDAAFR